MMDKTAYLIDMSGRDLYRDLDLYIDWDSSPLEILRRVVYSHQLVVSVSSGITTETSQFLGKSENVIQSYYSRKSIVAVQDFWQARKQGIFEFPGDQRYHLSQMALGLPGNIRLEVLHYQPAYEKYIDNPVLWVPITRKKEDDLSFALTVAYFQSYGFKVLGKNHHVVFTHDSIAPYEKIEVIGPGRVIHHGKDEVKIKEGRRRAMDEWEGMAMAHKRNHQQIFTDISQMRWNTAENNRATMAHARGHFYNRKPFR